MPHCSRQDDTKMRFVWSNAHFVLLDKYTRHRTGRKCPFPLQLQKIWFSPKVALTLPTKNFIPPNYNLDRPDRVRSKDHVTFSLPLVALKVDSKCLLQVKPDITFLLQPWDRGLARILRNRKRWSMTVWPPLWWSCLSKSAMAGLVLDCR